MQTDLHRVEPLSTFPDSDTNFSSRISAGEKVLEIFFYPGCSYYLCHVMKTIEVTIQEIKMATRPNIYKSKKNYTRKIKHKKVQ